jgi:hypothetical protein
MLNIKKRQRFGKLVTVRIAGRGKSGHILWHCKCDCGKTRDVPASHLMDGDTKSCGCLMNWKARFLPDREYLVQYLFRNYSQTAKQRGYGWELSESLFASLIFQNCHYCDQPPNNGNIVRRGCVLYYNGIDRVDNTLDYTDDNVVPCCKDCNQMKSDRPLKAFLAHIKRILERHGNG